MPDPGEPGPAPRPAASTIVHKSPAAGPPLPPPASPADTSRLRRTVAGADAVPLRGLPLHQKIMIAMAAVVVLASAAIVVAVYGRTLGLVDGAVDAKGARLARVLASIDREYWIAAMYQDPELRRAGIDRLVEEAWPAWRERRGAVFQRDPGLQRAYDQLAGRLGAEKKAAATAFLEELRTRAAESAAPGERERLDAAFRERAADPAWRERFDRLFDPLGRLQPLKASGLDLREGGEILQVSVVHLDAAGNAVASVQAVDALMDLADPAPHGTIDGVEVRDGRLVEKDEAGAPRPGLRPREARGFRLDVPEGSGRLRFFVILSLDHVAEARKGLLLAIVAPVFLSGIAGLVVAWWLARRITEPVARLVEDIEAVRGGRLDHRTVPRSGDEIGRLAVTFDRMTEALRLAHDQEVEAKALEHELGLAAEIQANLVPKERPQVPGADAGAYYRPSKEVGGDYWDHFEPGPGHAGFIVADVSGKGIPGSLVMAVTRSLVRMEAERQGNLSPADTLAKVNRLLARDIKKGMFVTALYAILDLRTGRLTVSSAGHNPLLVWRAATGAVESINPPGIALGFDRGPVFERTIAEQSVDLRPGDRVVMYTDGAVEAMSPSNEEYGDARFGDLVKSLATRGSAEFLDGVVRALDAWEAGSGPHDDLTIVTWRVLEGA